MARLPRLVVPGQLHAVVQRSHGAGPAFVDDNDRKAYLDAMRTAVREHQVVVHAYALLDHEVWWLATPADAAGISRAVQALGQRYVASFNRRHGLRGSRWDGRFRCAVVDAPRHGLQASLMIEQAPVRQGLAPVAGQWPWSSARHHAGVVRESWLTDPSWIWALGNTPYEREAAYGQALDAPIDPTFAQALEHAAARGWAVGSDEFLAHLQELAGRPVRPKPRGRPRASTMSPIKTMVK